MELESLPVVTFGKYKGQPVTTLLADTKYLEWCKQQDFFKQHKTVYNICVNQTIQSNQPSKTPEHNKLQNLFLKREFLLDIAKYLNKFDKTLSELEKLYCTEEYKKYFGDQRFDMNLCLKDIRFTQKFEAEFNWDVILYNNSSWSNYIYVNEIFVPDVKYYDSFTGKKERSDRSNEATTHVEELIERDLPYLHKICSKRCDKNVGEDEKYKVYLSVYFGLSTLYIEIKPLLGDDYPNVLRKMTTQIKLTKSQSPGMFRGEWILLIGEYSSTVTTKKELVQIFGLSDIRVMFVGDISNGLQCKPVEENLLEKIKQLEEKNRQLEEKVKQLELLQSK